MLEIELETVGYGAKYQTIWTGYCVANDKTRRAITYGETILAKSKKRIGKINKLRFEVEEGKIYQFYRQISVKPRKYEWQWFKVVNGQIQMLDETAAPHWKYEQMGYIIGGGQNPEDTEDFLAARGRWTVI
jgi:hypothetical protein